MQSPSVYDHLQPSGADYPDGIYRVVGEDGGVVTLLQVGDADGRRVNRGSVVSVRADELDGFTPARNPDGTRPLRAALRSRFGMVYWSIRVFLGQVVAHPIPATIAILLILVGFLGEGVLPVPDSFRGGLIIVGSLGLAYVGRGRLSR